LGIAAVGDADETTYAAWRSEMALRGKKPTTIEKRLKLLLFGKAGVGKTTAAIQFPKPYLIDTERGAENDSYVKTLNKQGGAYFFTNDPDELIAEVQALLSTKHDFKTLIIDPLTTIYNSLCDKGMKEKGEEFGRYKMPADRTVKHLLALLLRLDMNVIVTSHAKGEWANGAPTGKDTYDCYGKLDYLFDLALEVQKRGPERVGVVRKSRIDGFRDTEVFPFSYDDIAEKYGRKVLEREATPEVLATAEQIAELERLIDLLKVATDVTDKWLDKAGAANWGEMPAEALGKCIEHLKSQVKGAA
jgi:hypothetical protein